MRLLCKEEDRVRVQKWTYYTSLRKHLNNLSEHSLITYKHLFIPLNCIETIPCNFMSNT